MFYPKPDHPTVETQVQPAAAPKPVPSESKESKESKEDPKKAEQSKEPA
jgi:hypothetical protein